MSHSPWASFGYPPVSVLRKSRFRFTHPDLHSVGPAIVNRVVEDSDINNVRVIFGGLVIEISTKFRDGPS